MNEYYVVVEDRSGEWWEGSLVDGTRARQLEARGVVLLPTIPDLFRVSGVGAYHKRAWGAGLKLDRMTPRHVSPMTIYCSKEFTALHWRARLIPEPDLLEKLNGEGEVVSPDGFLRIIYDPSQPLPYKLGLMSNEMVDARSLTKNQLKDGGFDIGGVAKINAPGDAHYGVALYGMMSGLRVAWSAVSQAKE